MSVQLSVVVDQGFPDKGLPQTIIWPNFPRKRHENERNLTESGLWSGFTSCKLVSACHCARTRLCGCVKIGMCGQWWIYIDKFWMCPVPRLRFFISLPFRVNLAEYKVGAPPHLIPSLGLETPRKSWIRF